MRPVLDLYDHPPDDGRVVCADEFGPLNLFAAQGKAWRPMRTLVAQDTRIHHSVTSSSTPTAGTSCWTRASRPGHGST
jgi:hypothetical protein